MHLSVRTPHTGAFFRRAGRAANSRFCRIPAIPTALAEYKAEIGAGINAEKSILLPGEDPDPEAVQAVNETFGLLDRFFTAVMRFDQ